MVSAFTDKSLPGTGDDLVSRPAMTPTSQQAGATNPNAAMTAPGSEPGDHAPPDVPAVQADRKGVTTASGNGVGSTNRVIG